jgi:hypothetical protein
LFEEKLVVIFQVVLTNLEIHIFTTPTTFHGVTINNHDLKIVDDTNIAIDFMGNAMMNKIMGVSTVNKDDDLPMINVVNDIEGLGSREASKGMQQNQ